MAGPNSSERRSAPGGRVHVDVGLQAEQRAVDDVGEGVVDPLRRVRVRARPTRRMRGDVERAGAGTRAGAAITGSSWRGGSVVVASRERSAATWRSPSAPEPPATASSLSAARRERPGRPARSARRSRRGAPPTPGATVQPSASGVIGPSASVEALQLAGHLAGEVAEHVLLAGEVLVEGDPRAPGQLGDAVDAALVVAVLAEDPQGGVEDALLGALAAGADVRVVGERGAPQHGVGSPSSRRRRRRRPAERLGFLCGGAMRPSEVGGQVPTSGPSRRPAQGYVGAHLVLDRGDDRRRVLPVRDAGVLLGDRVAVLVDLRPVRVVELVQREAGVERVVEAHVVDGLVDRLLDEQRRHRRAARRCAGRTRACGRRARRPGTPC